MSDHVVQAQKQLNRVEAECPKVGLSLGTFCLHSVQLLLCLYHMVRHQTELLSVKFRSARTKAGFLLEFRGVIVKPALALIAFLRA